MKMCNNGSMTQRRWIMLILLIPAVGMTNYEDGIYLEEI
jgi:hypothetical protein